MRKLTFIAALLFLGLTACNNSGKNGNTSSDSSTMDNNNAKASSMNEVPPVPSDAKVFFKNLKDGQTVSSPFKVEMGVTDMKVEPSGKVIKGSGHHHLLIDDGDSLARGKVVPEDSTHLHFGKGQTETELTLAPGDHKLTLQFADGIHHSYGGQLAATIHVHVK